MRNILSSRILYGICLFFVLAVNMFILARVYLNRHGDIESSPVLTERELRITDKWEREDSGMHLRLVWRVLGDRDATRYSLPVWFDAQKLTELGFDLASYYNMDGKVKHLNKEPLPREVYLVFENNGKSYEKALALAEKKYVEAQKACQENPTDKNTCKEVTWAKRYIQRERMESSRLFCIDAGLDINILRKKYQDTKHFIIMKGYVEPRVRDKKIIGVVSSISVPNIHVPHKYRSFFDAINQGNKNYKDGFATPRFAVTLAFGSRLEPWIQTIRSINGTEEPWP